MINENLHKNAVALDRVKHRNTRLDTDARDLTSVAGLNAFFVASTEFGDACKEFPVVWVNAGKSDSGKPQVAPIAVFGLTQGRNLCIDGNRWKTRYVPAALRLYPFALARVSAEQMVVAIDESWVGFQESKGEALFGADGNPTEFTRKAQQQLEAFEQEVERTRIAGDMLVDKGLLRDMRFDATLPNGEKLSVDGFLTIDEDKLAKLSDADIVAMTRNGLMGLIHAHQISLGNMTKLAEWHVEKPAPAAAGAAAG